MRWVLLPVERFSEFSVQWDQLNEKNGGSPILSANFFEHLLKYFSNGKELIALLGPELEPVAMAIVYRKKNRVMGDFSAITSPHRGLAPGAN